jgi:hypothetical protein
MSVMVQTKQPTPDPNETDVEKLSEEYHRWLPKLQNYHVNRFDKNYRQYTAYTDVVGTKAKISDPVAPELVERVIQRMFPRNPSLFAMGHGVNLPVQIRNIVSGIASYFWTNPKMIESTGTMRSKLKVAGREFCVVGNVAVESYYNGDSESPDMRVIPIEDVIFDPSKTLKTSDKYYIRQFVDLEYLEEHAELEKDGKVVKGIFKNIDKIKKLLENKDALIVNDPSTNKINRSGSNLYPPIVGPIELISCWDGKHCIRFVVGLTDKNDKDVLVQEFDNNILDDDPLDFAMDIELPKQPYANSMLDFINGLTEAKDLSLNQIIDYGSKALNPPLFVDPSISNINKATLANAYKLGGLVFANPQLAEHKPMPPLNTIGFNLLEYMQQRSESVTGVGAYLGGVPNQSSDKTQGTKGGIQSLMGQAQSPVNERQLTMEECIVEPVVNKWLKYAGALMGKDEEKYAFISGEDPRWIKYTKGLLTGKITLSDLVACEIVDAKNVDPATNTTEAQDISQMLIENGKDPKSEIIFDVDWFVQVDSGSMSAVNAQEDIQALLAWAQFRMEHRMPTDYEKISDEIAIKSGVKHPEQYKIPVQPGGEDLGNKGVPFVMPRETINFKDLPPAGQAQMAASAGINITPQDIQQKQITDAAPASAPTSPMPGGAPTGQPAPMGA